MLSGQNDTQTGLYPLVTFLVQGLASVPQYIELRCEPGSAVAVSVTGDQRAQATFAVDEPDHPSLRVIKVASTKAARPGDTVDFTIRFDNLGDQELKRVVLVDNLTTRLEYVPGSAQSSRAAEFSTQVNEGDSLVLRWEFTEPLPVGAGGLVRFHCRVR